MNVEIDINDLCGKVYRKITIQTQITNVTYLIIQDTIDNREISILFVNQDIDKLKELRDTIDEAIRSHLI